MSPEEFRALTGYDAHPAAALFPMITGKRFDELVESVREKGLREPIVRIIVDGETLILDGRNRLVACKVAGVNPKFVEFVGNESSALDEVLCRNLHRRDLTESQRAAIAAEAANMRHGTNQFAAKVDGSMEPSTSTAAAAAGMLGVGIESVKRAKRVRAASPSLHEAVKGGDVSVRAAVEVAKRPELVLEVEQRIQSGEPRAEVVRDAVEKSRAAKVKPRVETVVDVVDLVEIAESGEDEEGDEATPPVRRWRPGDPFKPFLAVAYLRDVLREVSLVWSEADRESLVDLHLAIIDWVAVRCPRDDVAAQALRAAYEQSICEIEKWGSNG